MERREEITVVFWVSSEASGCKKAVFPLHCHHELGLLYGLNLLTLKKCQNIRFSYELALQKSKLTD